MTHKLLKKTQTAFTLLILAQALLPAHAQTCPPPSSPPPPISPSSPPSGQHPTLLSKYALRPSWTVAGVDYAVGVPSTTTLTDWQSVKVPGCTVSTSASPPRVNCNNTSNIVISGVDFSLHGGAIIVFVNSPNATVQNSNFGGPNEALTLAGVINADGTSPGLTVRYNSIDGGGAGVQSTLVSAGGGGTTTLEYNWLRDFSQHVIEVNSRSGAGTVSVVYKYNLVEQGGMTPGAHLNFLQFGTNTNTTSVDLEYNTFYQTYQKAGGEGYQFLDNGPSPIQNITMAYNVMIAAGTPTAMSAMVHGGGSQNAGIAHDNYVDPTSAYYWTYSGSMTGWNIYNNYKMTTGALISS